MCKNNKSGIQINKQTNYCTVNARDKNPSTFHPRKQTSTKMENVDWGHTKHTLLQSGVR